jgi:hypothetical protein
VDTVTFVVNASGPTLEVFNWADLTKVTFSATGGANHGDDGRGTEFVLDSLTINEPVSEPTTCLAGSAALGLALWLGRRRRA